MHRITEDSIEVKVIAYTTLMVHKEIVQYNNALTKEDTKTCNLLAKEISAHLPKAEYKIWHRRPVWFLEGNPIVGHSRVKGGLRLMFWSGADFNEPTLELGTLKFKDASITYNSVDEVDTVVLKRWLTKAKKIQWDYKNIVKRKGVLLKIEQAK